MKSPLRFFVIGCLIFWAVVFFPARHWGGQEGVVYSLVADVLCLAPTALTLWWAGREAVQPGPRQVFVVLGGTGLRMGVVLGVGLLLYLQVPYFQQTGFWIWLLVFYLYTLVLEIVLVQGGFPGGQGSPNPPGDKQRVA